MSATSEVRRTPVSLSSPMRDHVEALTLLRSRLAARHGLTVSEADALDLLADRPLSPTELGRRLRLTSGSVSALLDRLERFGYARREDDPGDRRRTTVRPTPAGVHAAHWSWRRMDRALDATLQHMADPPSREQLGALLSAAARAMAAEAELLPEAPGRAR